MFTIAKTFRFDAAHHLPHLSEGHKCRRPHGHTYRITFVLAADHLDLDGFVVDYGKLDDVKRWITDTLDHRDLNNVLSPSTAERLAVYAFALWRDTYPLVAVRVSETPDTYAEYRP